jgi:hypothetical protein
VNTGPGSTDVVAIVAVARASWPHDPAAGSQAVWVNWAGKLGPYSFDEVRAALDHLLLTHPRLPSLAEIVQLLKERRGALAEAERTNVIRLPRRVERTVEDRMQSLVDAAEEWRQQAREEYVAFARGRHLDDAEVERQLRALELDGPYARLARELLARDVAPGEGLGALKTTFAETS